MMWLDHRQWLATSRDSAYGFTDQAFLMWCELYELNNEIEHRKGCQFDELDSSLWSYGPR